MAGSYVVFCAAGIVCTRLGLVAVLKLVTVSVKGGQNIVKLCCCVGQGSVKIITWWTSMTLQPVRHRKTVVACTHVGLMVWLQDVSSFDILWHGGLLPEEGGGHFTTSSCVVVDPSEDVLRCLSVYLRSGRRQDVGVVVPTVVPAQVVPTCMIIVPSSLFSV